MVLTLLCMLLLLLVMFGCDWCCVGVAAVSVVVDVGVYDDGVAECGGVVVVVLLLLLLI